MIWAVSPNPMRRHLLAVAAGVLLLVHGPLQAQDFVYARFGDYLESLRVQTGIPGLAAVVVGRSDILWERGFGFQDVERALPMRPDTPTPIDGLTQALTAATILRCVEDGRLSLDTPVGRFSRNAAEPAATLRQVLSHTSGVGGAATFTYDLARLNPVTSAVRACEGNSYRESVSTLMTRLAMMSSVPGLDILSIVPPAEGIPSEEERVQYATTLQRLATLYAVDAQRRASPAQSSGATLTAAQGIVSTARDYAQFDIALRSGVLVRPETLAAAWRPPVDAAGRSLPHGVGWFVQNYNGETVVWQFGMGADQGSSSMAVTLPARGVTLVLVANSTGLARSFALEKGDIGTSPFARVFLALFTR
jgi:CubicO group peptidase (beta-lactamase class C family)